MKRICRYFAVAFVLSIVTSPAWSQTVTIGASKDNSIYEDNPTRSAGGSAGIFVGNNGLGSPRRGLIAFDVAANVPAGATITSAQLTLYLGASGGGADQSVELHRLNVDWGEGTAGSSDPTIAHGGRGFTAAPGDATWNQRFSGSIAWSNPGGTGDFDAAASASAVIPNIIEAPYTWSTGGMIGDIQGWLDNPASNFGWLLLNANEVASGTVRAFYSRTAASNAGGDPLDPSARPALTITYSVPEPGAVVLAGAAILLIFYRRGSR
jgi:hypothetical protein